jgi:hypothetical protein
MAKFGRPSRFGHFFFGSIDLGCISILGKDSGQRVTISEEESNINLLRGLYPNKAFNSIWHCHMGSLKDDRPYVHIMRLRHPPSLPPEWTFGETCCGDSPEHMPFRSPKPQNLTKKPFEMGHQGNDLRYYF